MAPPIIGAIRAANFGGLIPTESCSLSSERSYSPSRFHLWLSDQQPIQTFVIGVVIVALEGTAKTAGKYNKGATGPEGQPGERSWRTDPDAFAQVWPGVEEMLFREPELHAKVIFEESGEGVWEGLSPTATLFRAPRASMEAAPWSDRSIVCWPARRVASLILPKSHCHVVVIVRILLPFGAISVTRRILEVMNHPGRKCCA